MTDEAWLGVDTALTEQHKFCHVGNQENIKVSIQGIPTFRDFRICDPAIL